MRIVKQAMIPPNPLNRAELPDFDVRTNSLQQFPPPILLDFTYGVAAYARWQSHTSEEFRAYMERRSTEVYKSPPPKPVHSPDSGDPDNCFEEDSGYTSEEELSVNRLKAMDELALLGGYLSGLTPEVYAERQRKRAEEEELREQEASREKVQQWLQR
jgi:hypothetical protein